MSAPNPEISDVIYLTELRPSTKNSPRGILTVNRPFLGKEISLEANLVNSQSGPSFNLLPDLAIKRNNKLDPEVITTNSNDGNNSTLQRQYSLKNRRIFAISKAQGILERGYIPVNPIVNLSHIGEFNFISTRNSILNFTPSFDTKVDIIVCCAPDGFVIPNRPKLSFLEIDRFPRGKTHNPSISF